MSLVFLCISICLSFNSCGTHIYRSSESFPSPVVDWTQLVNSRAIVRRVGFANHLHRTMLAIPHLKILLTVFHVLSLPSCLASKSPLLKGRNHRFHVSCDEARSP